MAAGEDAWVELMIVSLGVLGTSVRVGEMMVASGSVVGARMTIIGNAARSPVDGDYEELGGMVQEKVEAFSAVGQSLFGHWSAMAIDTAEQTHRVGRLAFCGRPLGPGDLMGLAEIWLTHSTRTISRTIELGELALAPVHQHATDNARRLG